MRENVINLNFFVKEKRETGSRSNGANRRSGFYPIFEQLPDLSFIVRLEFVDNHGNLHVSQNVPVFGPSGPEYYIPRVEHVEINQVHFVRLRYTDENGFFQNSFNFHIPWPPRHRNHGLEP